MGKFHRLQDALIRRAPHIIAGVFATVALSRLLPWLWPLVAAESAATAIACFAIVGRWRSFEPWDALGFTSYRDFLAYKYGFKGKPLGLVAATSAGALLLYAIMAPLAPPAFFAIISTMAFCTSVASARGRWPVDALEKASDR